MGPRLPAAGGGKPYVAPLTWQCASSLDPKKEEGNREEKEVWRKAVGLGTLSPPARKRRKPREPAPVCLTGIRSLPPSLTLLF